MTTVLFALFIALITMFLPDGVVEVEAPDVTCLSTDAQLTRTILAGDPSTLLLLDLIKTVSVLPLLDSPTSPFTELCDDDDEPGGCSKDIAPTRFPSRGPFDTDSDTGPLGLSTSILVTLESHKFPSLDSLPWITGCTEAVGFSNFTFCSDFPLSAEDF